MGLLSHKYNKAGNFSSEKSGFIQVTGGQVWYKIIGAEAPGVPLLALHGGPGAPHDYLETLEALADERPVIFYDQLGCGFSDRPSDTALFTVSRFVDEVKQVCNALHLDKFHILGQSWAGMLALDSFYKNNPQVCAV